MTYIEFPYTLHSAPPTPFLGSISVLYEYLTGEFLWMIVGVVSSFGFV